MTDEIFYSFKFSSSNLLEESEEDDYFEIETDFRIEKSCESENEILRPTMIPIGNSEIYIFVVNSDDDDNNDDDKNNRK